MGLFSSKKKQQNTARWLCQTHLFGADTFECSACHKVYKKRTETCPGCGALMVKDKYDPQWVDELAALDAIFED